MSDISVPGMGDISVIVPVYNVRDYLEHCLESIAAQTLKPKEVLLVNDGSTDGSREICEKFSREHGHVQLIDQENQGQSAARNTGLDHATGQYIVFIDSDDYVSENMLAVLHDKAVQSGADIVKCGIRFIFGDGRTANMKGMDKQELVLNDRMDFFQALFDNRFKPSVCNAIYRKEMFEDLRFDVGRLMEDSFLTPHLLLTSDKIVTIPDELYSYRQRDGSTMHTFSDHHFDLIESIIQLKELLIRYHLFDTFRDSFYAWSRFHFMITIKNAARHSSYFQYKKHVRKLNRLVPDKELQKVISADMVAKQGAVLSGDQISSFKKAKTIIQSFRKNPNLFWLKVKYSQWKKSGKKDRK